MYNYFTPGIQVAAKGGLTVAKAKEILRDGTINGKPLTKKQRGYFGFIAGGGTPKAQVGGPLAPDQNASFYNNANSAYLASNQVRDSRYADNLNQLIASGYDPYTTTQGQASLAFARSQFNPAFANNLGVKVKSFQTSENYANLTPEQRLSQFYNVMTGDPQIDDYLKRVKPLGGGPAAYYQNSKYKQMGGMTLTTPEEQAQGFNNPQYQQFDSLEFPANSPDQARYFTPASVPVMAQDQQGNLAYLGPGAEGQYLQGAVNEYQMERGGMMTKEQWNMLPPGLRKRIQTNLIKKMGGYAKDC